MFTKPLGPNYEVRTQGGAFIDIAIRTANNADVEQINRLVFAVLAEFGLPPDPLGKDSDLADIEQNYFCSGGVFEIIEGPKGDLLGTCGLFRIDDETCELRKMYFVPAIREQGLGRLILDRAVRHARRLGYRSIMLETTTVLEQAIRLYTRFGFVRTHTHNVSDRIDQTYILNLELIDRAP
ncbi:hypothetical protein BH10ACI2_BH10ACI2_04960 [soil metagenome]